MPKFAAALLCALVSWTATAPATAEAFAETVAASRATKGLASVTQPLPAAPAAPAIAAAAHHRAVALAPHIVELVFAAGAGHLLVGVARGSNYPDTATSIQSVGDGTHLSAEHLLALRPDLVIGWQPAPLRALLPLLQAQRIDVVYSDPQRLQDIGPNIERLGALLGTTPQAHRQSMALAARLDALRAQYRNATPVRVFIQVAQDPLYSVGETSIVSDALRTCGAVNVMGQTGIVAPRTSVESVLATQPDAILAGTLDEPDRQDLVRFWRSRGWPTQAAESDARFITLNADTLYRATPRLIDATETLCRQLQSVRAMMRDTQKRMDTPNHDR